MLCYGVKILSNQDYYNWQFRYDVLDSTNLSELEIKERRDRLVTELENNILILGASGIKDRLQDRVEETITELKAANIKVWMLTGDRKETAKKIAESSKLISKDTELKSLDSASEHDLEYSII